MKPGTLCNRCMACVKACPGAAMPIDKTVKVKLGGYDVEWTDIDCRKCDIAMRGAEEFDGERSSPYPPYMAGRENTRPGSWSPFYEKPRNLYNTGQAICGARGCTRACMISMESRGVIKSTFHDKFRRRPQWSVDWSRTDGEATEAGAAMYVRDESD